MDGVAGGVVEDPEVLFAPRDRLGALRGGATHGRFSYILKVRGASVVGESRLRLLRGRAAALEGEEVGVRRRGPEEGLPLPPAPCVPLSLAQATKLPANADDLIAASAVAARVRRGEREGREKRSATAREAAFEAAQAASAAAAAIARVGLVGRARGGGRGRKRRDGAGGEEGGGSGVDKETGVEGVWGQASDALVGTKPKYVLRELGITTALPSWVVRRPLFLSVLARENAGGGGGLEGAAEAAAEAGNGKMSKQTSESLGVAMQAALTAPANGKTREQTDMLQEWLQRRLPRLRKAPRAAKESLARALELVAVGSGEHFAIGGGGAGGVGGGGGGGGGGEAAEVVYFVVGGGGVVADGLHLHRVRTGDAVGDVVWVRELVRVLGDAGKGGVDVTAEGAWGQVDAFVAKRRAEARKARASSRLKRGFHLSKAKEERERALEKANKDLRKERRRKTGSAKEEEVEQWFGAASKAFESSWEKVVDSKHQKEFDMLSRRTGKHTEEDEEDEEEEGEEGEEGESDGERRKGGEGESESEVEGKGEGVDGGEQGTTFAPPSTVSPFSSFPPMPQETVYLGGRLVDVSAKGKLVPGPADQLLREEGEEDGARRGVEGEARGVDQVLMRANAGREMRAPALTLVRLSFASAARAWEAVTSRIAREDAVFLRNAVPSFAKWKLPRLAALSSLLERRSFEAGETILRQGTPANTLCILRSGAAETVLEGVVAATHARPYIPKSQPPAPTHTPRAPTPLSPIPSSFPTYTIPRLKLDSLHKPATKPTPSSSRIPPSSPIPRGAASPRSYSARRHKHKVSVVKRALSVTVRRMGPGDFLGEESVLAFAFDSLGGAVGVDAVLENHMQKEGFSRAKAVDILGISDEHKETSGSSRGRWSSESKSRSRDTSSKQPSSTPTPTSSSSSSSSSSILLSTLPVMVRAAAEARRRGCSGARPFSVVATQASEVLFLPAHHIPALSRRSGHARAAGWASTWRSQERERARSALSKARAYAAERPHDANARAAVQVHAATLASLGAEDDVSVAHKATRESREDGDVERIPDDVSPPSSSSFPLPPKLKSKGTLSHGLGAEAAGTGMLWRGGSKETMDAETAKRAARANLSAMAALGRSDRALQVGGAEDGTPEAPVSALGGDVLEALVQLASSQPDARTMLQARVADERRRGAEQRGLWHTLGPRARARRLAQQKAEKDAAFRASIGQGGKKKRARAELLPVIRSQFKAVLAPPVASKGEGEEDEEDEEDEDEIGEGGGGEHGKVVKADVSPRLKELDEALAAGTRASLRRSALLHKAAPRDGLQRPKSATVDHKHAAEVIAVRTAVLTEKDERKVMMEEEDEMSEEEEKEGEDLLFSTGFVASAGAEKHHSVRFASRSREGERLNSALRESRESRRTKGWDLSKVRLPFVALGDDDEKVLERRIVRQHESGVGKKDAWDVEERDDGIVEAPTRAHRPWHLRPGAHARVYHPSGLMPQRPLAKGEDDRALVGVGGGTRTPHAQQGPRPPVRATGDVPEVKLSAALIEKPPNQDEHDPALQESQRHAATLLDALVEKAKVEDAREAAIEERRDIDHKAGVDFWDSTITSME